MTLNKQKTIPVLDKISVSISTWSLVNVWYPTLDGVWCEVRANSLIWYKIRDLIQNETIAIKKPGQKG